MFSPGYKVYVCPEFVNTCGNQLTWTGVQVAKRLYRPLVSPRAWFRVRLLRSPTLKGFPIIESFWRIILAVIVHKTDRSLLFLPPSPPSISRIAHASLDQYYDIRTLQQDMKPGCVGALFRLQTPMTVCWISTVKWPRILPVALILVLVEFGNVDMALIWAEKGSKSN